MIENISRMLETMTTPCWSSSDANGNGVPQTRISDPILTWAMMEEKLLLRLLRFLNYSDVLQCRCINRHFLKTISASTQLINSTLFVSSLKPGEETDSFFLEKDTPWESTRIEYLDYDVYMNLKSYEDTASDNHHFNPPPNFLQNLNSLEFHNCFLTWETIKRIVNQTPLLQSLSLTRCKFSEQKTIAALDEFSEFHVGRTFSSLKNLKINEHHDLNALNKFLGKSVGYNAHCLELLQITFDLEVETEATSVPDMDQFYSIVRMLIEMNAPVLKVLGIDIKHRQLLNSFIPNVFGQMDMWGEKNTLNLEEFVLSPPGCSVTPTAIDISQQCMVSAQVLIGFLSSQPNLKKAALPHFKTLREPHYRVKIGASLPPSIEYLCLPNQEYLPQDFLSRFKFLKKLYVGGSKGEHGMPVALRSEMFDHSDAFLRIHPAGLPSDIQLNLAGSRVLTKPSNNCKAWDNLKELGIGSTIINGMELMQILKKFHFLSKLEVSSQLPVIQDEDLQCLIKTVPGLQFLSVSACDFLTDFGVTGILRNSCEMIIRLDSYREVEDDGMFDSKTKGRPLSHLKDVGLHFGMRFQELQTACLPYNKNVTDWGVIKFGQNNPSLQVFVMCSVNLKSQEGFMTLKQAHPRIRKNKCTYLNYTEEEASQVPDLPGSLMKFDILKNAIANSMNGMCSSLTFNWIFGKSKDEYEEKALEEEPDEMIPIPTISLILPSFKMQPPPPLREILGEEQEGQDFKVGVVSEDLDRLDNNVIS